MESLEARVSYLKGLLEGLELDADTKQNKLLKELVSVMYDMADEIDKLESRNDWLEEYIESLDEDLLTLEEDFYEFDDDDDDDDDEEFCCDSDSCEDCEDYVEVQCPKCNEVVCFPSELLDSEDIIEVACPNCDTIVFCNEDDEDEDEDEEKEDEDEK